MNTLGKYLLDEGVLVITIRPEEYWKHDPQISEGKKYEMILSHKSIGYAFNPHNREPVDGEITYGDTSMSVEWIKRHFPQWEIVATERSNTDPLQVYVFMIRKRLRIKK